MTDAEHEALWEWGPTRAEVYASQADAGRRDQRARDAATIGDYRQRHPQATSPLESVILTLAQMEAELRKRNAP